MGLALWLLEWSAVAFCVGWWAGRVWLRLTGGRDEKD